MRPGPVPRQTTLTVSQSGFSPLSIHTASIVICTNGGGLRGGTSKGTSAEHSTGGGNSTCSQKDRHQDVEVVVVALQQVAPLVHYL